MLVKFVQAPMLTALIAAPVVAGLGAMLFGWFAVRLSGIYLAMVTLAFAQIVWSIVFQWQDFTGGSIGVLGVWPSPPFDAPWRFYLLTLAVAVAVVVALRTIVFSPFGYAMRAGRDSPLRAEAIGIDVKRIHWIAFAMAGAAAGLAGGPVAFAQGALSPQTINLSRSLHPPLLGRPGGLESPRGPVGRAGRFATLQATATPPVR